ncbi:MAG: choice-of-anchor X domain-containing protein [Bacteroidota bacterium]
MLSPRQLQVGFLLLSSLFAVLPLGALAQVQPLWTVEAGKQCDGSALGETKAQICVRLNPTALDAAMQSAPSTSWAIPLFDTTAVFTPERLVQHASSAVTLHGSLSGSSTGTALFVREGDVVEGLFSTAEGQFVLRPRANGGHLLAHLREVESPHANDVILPGSVKPRFSANALPTTREDLVVDLLLLYTPATRDSIEATSTVSAYLTSWVEWTNQAFAFAGHENVSLRVVGFREVDYDASSSVFTDLQRLSAPDDGIMDEAYRWRTETGADLVTLITPGPAGCGFAQFNWPTADRDNPFAVTALQCGAPIFAHELGHNFGMHHDPYVAPGTFPFSFAHGYVDAERRFRTVMAYNTICYTEAEVCPRIQRYSSADSTYEGAPLGTRERGRGASSDNARVLGIMAPLVSAFRTPMPPGPVVSGRLLADQLAASRARVVLEGPAVSRTTTSDGQGYYAFADVPEGQYTLRVPKGPGLAQEVTQSVARIADQDALANVALAPSRAPLRLATSAPPTIRPGASSSLVLTFENTTDSLVNVREVRVAEDAALGVFNPSPGKFDTAATIAPGATMALLNPVRFTTSGTLQAGETLRIPLYLYDSDDAFLGTDTLSVIVEGTDVYPPSVSITALAYAPVDEPLVITASISDQSAVSSAEAKIYDYTSQRLLPAIPLYDTGTHGDVTAGDGVYAGTFTPEQETDYRVSVTATDVHGTEGSSTILLTSAPFVSQSKMLLITESGSLSAFLSDPSGARRNDAALLQALDRIDREVDHWRGYLLGSVPDSVLNAYDTWIWSAPPETPFPDYARHIIATHVQRGGRVLIVGDALVAGASERWLRTYLSAEAGATTLESRITGLPGDWIGDDLGFNISPPARGSRSTVEAIPPATSFLSFGSDPTSLTAPSAGIRVADSLGTRIQLAFSIAELTSASARAMLLERSLAWLANPNVQVATAGPAELPLELGSNYPNPFTAHTNIAYTLPRAMPARLVVYDLLGRQVAVLADHEVQHAGTHTVTVDARTWPSGVYAYTLEAEGQRLQGTMILVR